MPPVPPPLTTGTLTLPPVPPPLTTGTCRHQARLRRPGQPTRSGRPGAASGSPRKATRSRTSPAACRPKERNASPTGVPAADSPARQTTPPDDPASPAGQPLVVSADSRCAAAVPPARWRTVRPPSWASIPRGSGFDRRPSDGPALGGSRSAPDAVVLAVLERPGPTVEGYGAAAAYRLGEEGPSGSGDVREREEDLGVFSDAGRLITPVGGRRVSAG